MILPAALRNAAAQPVTEGSRLPDGIPTEDESLLLHLRALLATGREIDAIKLYREKYFVGLKKAKDAVEAIEAGLQDSLPGGRNPPDATASQPAAGLDRAAFLAELLGLARQGNKIEAIKRYRQVYPVGLKEAKDAVEAIEAGQDSVPWGENQPGAAANLPQPAAGLDQAAFLAELQSLIRQGNKIEAVKRYRQAYPVGLKDALFAVNGIEAGTLQTLPTPEAEAARLQQEAEAAEQDKRAGLHAIPFSVDRSKSGDRPAGSRGALWTILSILLIAALVLGIGLLAVRCSGPTPETAAPWLSVLH